MSSNPWAIEGEVQVEVQAEREVDMVLTINTELDNILATLDRLNPDQGVTILARMTAYMLLHLAPPNQEHLLADAFCHALHMEIEERKTK